MVLGISDLRGIEKQVEVNWGKTTAFFSPGTPSNSITQSGLHTEVTFKNDSSVSHAFSLRLILRGSQLLYFLPTGKTTEVSMASTWPDPAFKGAFLPKTHSISDDGFTAEWSVLDLNRKFPPWWTNERYRLDQSAFGVDFIVPVDDYQKTYRSIHYAILFIGLTFLVFFFIEVSRKVRIHAIQYLLVGMALVVFYTLLLSMSEHLDYNLAFGLSAFATIALISAYVKAVLKSRALTSLIAGILTTLYGFIFVVIQLQDFALLIGSIGIFIILALTMFFSRKIDWSNARGNDESNG